MVNFKALVLYGKFLYEILYSKILRGLVSPLSGRIINLQTTFKNRYLES